MTVRARGGKAFVAMLSSGALLAAVACNGDGDSGGAADGDVTLVVETFGTFGYEEVIEQFEEDTGIQVEERTYGELADWNDTLNQNLAAGSGLGDVVAIEEGILPSVMETADQFHDLADYGAADMQNEFVPWKWELGVTPEGQILGLGTDIGGMAICYRSDYYEDAGLPSDRDEVSEMWESWEDFVEVGTEFRDSDVDAAFVDTVTEYANAIARQHGDYIYFDEGNELYIEDSAAIDYSWDIAGELIEEDLTAQLDMWSDDWTAAIQAGSFATMPCPAWMLGQIEENAGEGAEGLWDVAEVPGDGGNWGGSWLGVPTHTDHPEEAAELAMYLSGPEGQLGAWELRNNLPSNPDLLQSEDVHQHTNAYFNDAPVGEVYAAGALDLQPVHFGVGHFPVQEAANDQLEAWQSGEIGRDEAWEGALAEAERAS